MFTWLLHVHELISKIFYFVLKILPITNLVLLPETLDASLEIYGFWVSLLSVMFSTLRLHVSKAEEKPGQRFVRMLNVYDLIDHLYTI